MYVMSLVESEDQIGFDVWQAINKLKKLLLKDEVLLNEFKFRLRERVKDKELGPE